MNDNKIFNIDCIEGFKRHFSKHSADLQIADPPFGNSIKDLYRAYRKKSDRVIGGYQNAPKDYYKFSLDWITEATRVLKPTGTIYIVSGFNNLEYILAAARLNNLILRSHIIWQYTFGLPTKNKFRSAHASILHYTKSDAYTFNTHCRYDDSKNLYSDLGDVWSINREHHKNKDTNLTKLPTELVCKMIAYSSNVDDLVVDPFLGNGTTIIACKKLQRRYSGFEINPDAYKHILNQLGK